jgi:hypothetical protein
VVDYEVLAFVITSMNNSRTSLAKLQVIAIRLFFAKGLDDLLAVAANHHRINM